MKKLIASVIALIITTVAVFSAQTVAYFSDGADIRPVVTLTGANLSGELIETTASATGGEPIVGPAPLRIRPGTTVQKSVAVKNTGDLEMYLRLTVDKAFVLSAENEGEPTDPDLVYFEINEAYWAEDGDYYYYRKPLAHGQTTEPLFSEVSFSGEMGNIYTNSTITLCVTAYAVQVNGNGTCVFDAQGWPDEQ